jgi:hypothetical protein
MSRTADQVYDLLSAMNQETLGRIEQELKAIHQLLDAVNQTTLGRMEGKINYIDHVFRQQEEIREGQFHTPHQP